MDDKNPTAPGAPMSFNTKVVLGSFAAVFLWMVFGPNSKPAPTDEKSPPKAVATPIEKPKVRKGRYVMTGTRVRMIATAPACSSLDNLSKFRQLATEGDRQAVVKMVDRQDCRILEVGTSVTVQDASVWRGAECVRLPSEIDCLWTITEATEAPAEP